MPLSKNITTTFGAAVGYHRAVRVEGNLADETVAVVVHSWPSEADWIAHGGKGQTFVWYVAVPIESLNGGLAVAAVEQAIAGQVLNESPFDGSTYVAPADDIDALKQRQWAGIKQTRDLLIVQPIFMPDGVCFDATERSQQRIVTAIVGMRASGETTRDWVCADNISRPLSLDALEAVGAAIDGRNSALTLTAAALRSQLDQAETAAAVLAVVWPVESPSP